VKWLGAARRPSALASQPSALTMVSVVLVSWNTREMLHSCLESLRPQIEACKGEVWVVDNDSADGSADMVADRHPWAHLVRNPSNDGFARACNLVLPRITNSLIFFFNPDATLDDGSLQAMVNVMAANPRLGASMPKLLNADGRPTHFVGRAPRLLAIQLRLQRSLVWRFPRSPALRAYWERSAARYLAHSADSGGPFERKQLEGAALMVRRSAMEEVGSFDPAFFCGYEETDLTIRMRKAGWGLGVTPLATARHWDQQSRLQWTARPWEIPDGFYFVRKHKGRLRLLLHYIVSRRRLRHFAAWGFSAAELRAQQETAFRALWRAPEHPGNS
jgi:N-acetylglucosaminyl-diphospho-decaprenol L-rhamnosyltransferase